MDAVRKRMCLADQVYCVLKVEDRLGEECEPEQVGHAVLFEDVAHRGALLKGCQGNS